MGGWWWRREEESRALRAGVCRAQSAQTSRKASPLSPVMRWGAPRSARTRARDLSLASRLRAQDGAPPLTETPELPPDNNRLVTSSSIRCSASPRVIPLSIHPSQIRKIRTGDARAKGAFVDARESSSLQRQLSVYRWWRARRGRKPEGQCQWRLMFLQRDCFLGFLPRVCGRVHLSSASFHSKHPLPALRHSLNAQSQPGWRKKY